MSEPTPSLVQAIESHLAPSLRRDGFAGTGERYWRVIADQCQVVEVQDWQDRDKFAVNLGIQPLSAPLLSRTMPDPKRLLEMECVLRARLAIKGRDQWWDYQQTQESMNHAVRAACSVYEQVGRDRLLQMAQPDLQLNTITPQAFVAGTFDFKGFGWHRMLIARTLAHVSKAGGRAADARAFAMMALNEIGDRPDPWGLDVELRQLLESV